MIKFRYTFLALFISFSSFADDSFTVIRDGKEYLCQQTGPLDPIDSAACAQRAYSGPFSSEQSIELCAGSRNTAPAECGIKAYKGPFSVTDAIILCKNAEEVQQFDQDFDVPSGINNCISSKP